MTKPRVLEIYPTMEFLTGKHYHDPSHSRLLVVGHSFYLNRCRLIPAQDWYHELRAKQHLTSTDFHYINLERNLYCGRTTGK